MNSTDRQLAEVATIDKELRRRMKSGDPDLTNTSVQEHFNLMSPDTQATMLELHEIAEHGNSRMRRPFETKVDPPRPGADDIDKDALKIHSRFADEKTIVSLNDRMGTIQQNQEISRRENSTPSLRDTIDAATLVHGD